MNCKNLKIRSKNYKKYFYCTEHGCVVDASTCYCCKIKEYKQYKELKRTAIKVKSHKVSNMAKECDISMEVKQKVWERDNHKCIFCKKEVPVTCANAHFVPRSAGGLGIPENIFTACPKCHHEQDNGKNTALYDSLAKIYLQSKYKNFNIKNLIYKKYNWEVAR